MTTLPHRRLLLLTVALLLLPFSGCAQPAWKGDVLPTSGRLALSAELRGKSGDAPLWQEQVNLTAPGTSPALGASAPAARKILLGVDVLERSGFSALRGKRVGLLTNPAGVNRDGVSTVEVLRRGQKAGGYQLVALFGPEHGIYGDEAANAPVTDKVDPRTKIPVYSLYGATRKPTPAMLAKVDVFVIDLQDLGVRTYTYISSLRLVMEACFPAGKEVVVLDRPNPLGGLKVDGPNLEKRYESFVGKFQMPYVHGMTIGEIALMTKYTAGWMDLTPEQAKAGKLTIVPLQGWSRQMQWPDTGLAWVPTSPGIPTVASAFGYAITGLGTQLGGFSHAYGTPYSFRLIRHSVKSPEDLKTALDGRHIPGLAFAIQSYTHPKTGKVDRGVYVQIANWNTLRPTELSFHLMQLAATWDTPNPFLAAKSSEQDLFNKHLGEGSFLESLKTQGPRGNLPQFLVRWDAASKNFQKASRAFWLYN